MPKEIYTERDIVDLVNQGVSSLVITDDVVLTDLAWEKAKKLGFKLIQENDAPPPVPIRPYLNKELRNQSAPKEPRNQQSEMKKKVSDAVIARLGKDVDPVLLDNVIERVLRENDID